MPRKALITVHLELMTKDVLDIFHSCCEELVDLRMMRFNGTSLNYSSVGDKLQR